jgi:tripeptide aminopeptidase
LIASRAISDVAARGFFGKIVKGRHSGTSNVGILKGGEATNQVTDYVYVKGESRSHNKALLSRITGEYKKAFERAAASVKNSAGERGKIEFVNERDYEAFRMKTSEASVAIASKAVEALGMTPDLVISNGGLDANYLNAKGVPTVTLGAGQHNPHTVDEYVEISEFLDGCRLLVQVAQTE